MPTNWSRPALALIAALGLLACDDGGGSSQPIDAGAQADNCARVCGAKLAECGQATDPEAGAVVCEQFYCARPRSAAELSCYATTRCDDLAFGDCDAIDGGAPRPDRGVAPDAGPGDLDAAPMSDAAPPSDAAPVSDATPTGDATPGADAGPALPCADLCQGAVDCVAGGEGPPQCVAFPNGDAADQAAAACRAACVGPERDRFAGLADLACAERVDTVRAAAPGFAAVCGSQCPVPRAARGVIQAPPLEAVLLDGSASTGAADIVEWRWTVVQRPAGSVSQPTEPGGGPDDAATPTAELVVDLAGDYTVSLAVVDREGRAAPSDACPVGGEVRIKAQPTEDLRVELTWDTPVDPDQTDDDGTDLDVHLRHPNSAGWFTAPWNIYSLEPTADWGPEGPAGDPQLDIDDADGLGPENINLDDPEETAPLGAPYGVGVHQFRATLGPDEAIPAPSTATIRIYFAGEVVHEASRLLPATDNFWEAANVHWENGRGRVEVTDVFHEVAPEE